MGISSWLWDCCLQIFEFIFTHRVTLTLTYFPTCWFISLFGRTMHLLWLSFWIPTQIIWLILQSCSTSGILPCPDCFLPGHASSHMPMVLGLDYQTLNLDSPLPCTHLLVSLLILLGPNLDLRTESIILNLFSYHFAVASWSNSEIKLLL